MHEYNIKNTCSVKCGNNCSYNYNIIFGVLYSNIAYLICDKKL